MRSFEGIPDKQEPNSERKHDTPTHGNLVDNHDPGGF